jgi:alanyl-tRNA synthetase/misacylated tRNA(Ala) deacylase
MAEPPAAKGRAKQKKPSSGAQTPNGTSTPPANGSGGANEAEKEDKGRLWEVQLEDTIIFPEGGGQPFDTGSIVFGNGKDGARTLSVEGCLRRKLDSVHLVRVDKQDEEFVQSLAGREVTVKVDWKRRMDHVSLLPIYLSFVAGSGHQHAP